MQRAFDEKVEAVDVDRLGDKVIGAGFHGSDRVLDAPVSGHHDADRSVVLPEGPLEQVHPVVGAEAQVGQEQVDAVGFHDGLGPGCVGGDVDLVVVLQRGAQALAGIFLVVDDEDGFFQGMRGFEWDIFSLMVGRGRQHASLRASRFCLPWAGDGLLVRA